MKRSFINKKHYYKIVNFIATQLILIYTYKFNFLLILGGEKMYSEKEVQFSSRLAIFESIYDNIYFIPYNYSK
jgi:hypothetical protein